MVIISLIFFVVLSALTHIQTRVSSWCAIECIFDFDSLSGQASGRKEKALSASKDGEKSEEAYIAVRVGIGPHCPRTQKRLWSSEIKHHTDDDDDESASKASGGKQKIIARASSEEETDRQLELQLSRRTVRFFGAVQEVFFGFERRFLRLVREREEKIPSWSEVPRVVPRGLFLFLVSVGKGVDDAQIRKVAPPPSSRLLRLGCFDKR